MILRILLTASLILSISSISNAQKFLNKLKKKIQPKSEFTLNYLGNTKDFLIAKSQKAVLQIDDAYYQIPSECYCTRNNAGDQSGRIAGNDQNTRATDGDTSKREGGMDNSGRQMGGDASSRAGNKNGAGRNGAGDASGRMMGGDVSNRAGNKDGVGRDNAGDASGRTMGGDTSGRSGAGDASGRAGAGDDSGRNGAGETAGRDKGADYSNAKCKKLESCNTLLLNLPASVEKVIFYNGDYLKTYEDNEVYIEE